MSHVHQELTGGRASKEAGYPDELCRAICRGIANEKRYDLSGKVCTGSLDSLSLKSLLEPGTFQFPAHWIDSMHAPEGSAHEFLATDTVVEEEALGAFRVGHNDGADLLRAEMSNLVAKYSGYVECRDDVSGAPLDAKRLRAARAVEMQFVEKMNVWAESLPKLITKARGGTIIQGRWVDTNTGDSACPGDRALSFAKTSTLELTLRFMPPRLLLRRSSV